MAGTANVDRDNIWTIEGMACTSTSIEIPEDLSHERWKAALCALGPVQRGAPWWLGDLIVFAGKHYGSTYDAAERATGYQPQTLRVFAWVARKCPPEMRRAELSWRSHKIVAPLPEAERAVWLNRAAEEGWSSDELARALRGETGGATVEMIGLLDLKPHPRNYRKHPEDQREHIRESIREHGVYRNLVAANDGTILAGHGVWEAAREEGLTEVPGVKLPIGPDDPKALKILTADNELPLTAQADTRLLTDVLKEVHDEEGLVGTGYDEQRLANLAYVSRPEKEIKDFDEAAHWVGLPGYEPAPPPPQVIVSFENGADREKFMEVIGTKVVHNKNRRTWSVWWPPKARGESAQAECVEEAT